MNKDAFCDVSDTSRYEQRYSHYDVSHMENMKQSSLLNMADLNCKTLRREIK